MYGVCRRQFSTIKRWRVHCSGNRKQNGMQFTISNFLQIHVTFVLELFLPKNQQIYEFPLYSSFLLQLQAQSVATIRIHRLTETCAVEFHVFENNSNWCLKEHATAINERWVKCRRLGFVERGMNSSFLVKIDYYKFLD